MLLAIDVRNAHTIVGLISGAGENAKVVAFSALDNMIKGASGQAIQNMNLVFEQDETAGLL